LAGFEENKQKLAELGVSVFAASVDSEERAREVADSGLSFPVAHGVTREDADRLGSWWEGRRNYIQPSEFVIRKDGRVISSTYSSAPIGRLDAADVVSLLGFLAARAKKSA
jgi:peroxiredoxin